MSSIQKTNLALYNDVNNINQIKAQANSKEGLKQAAAQFETLFLQMVLKSMRSAADAFSGEDSLTGSEQQKVYRDMYDGQLTTMMSAKGKIGIKEAMVRQLSPTIETQNFAQNSLKNRAETVAETKTSAAFSQPLLSITKH